MDERILLIYQGGYIPDLGIIQSKGRDHGWLVYRHPDNKWVTLANLNSFLTKILLDKSPVILETIQGLVAQGWCTEKNKHKEMDSDLASAITEIIWKEIALLKAEKADLKVKEEGDTEQIADLQAEVFKLRIENKQLDKDNKGLTELLAQPKYALQKEVNNLEKQVATLEADRERHIAQYTCLGPEDCSGVTCPFCNQSLEKEKNTMDIETERLDINVSKEVYDALETICHEQNRPIGNVINELLKKALQELNND